MIDTVPLPGFTMNAASFAPLRVPPPALARSTGRGLSRSRNGRCAASAVEFAVIAPFLALLVIGMLEIGRGLMVKEMLSDAAQKGCRTGVLPAKSNTDIQNDVNNIMSDNGVSSCTITILVNGVVADVSTAKRFDQVSVKVSVPVSQVFWTTTFFLTNQMVESETVIMMRQG
jgi:Flp pilus assembly protein TadG